MNHLSKSPSYIIRNPYSYYFRMKVPIDIQEYVGKKELRYSLRTGYLGVAKQKARYLAGQVQFIFRVLRRGALIMVNLSDDQIKGLVNKYVKQSLDWINNWFHDVSKDDCLPYTTESEFYSYLDELDAIRRDLIVNLNTGNFEMLEGSISNFLKEQGIKDIDKNSVEFQRLCVGIHQTEIKLLPIQIKHMRSDLSYKDELPDIFPDVFDRLPKEAEPTPIPPEKSSETLGKVINPTTLLDIK